MVENAESNSLYSFSQVLKQGELNPVFLCLVWLPLWDNYFPFLLCSKDFTLIALQEMKKKLI